MSSSTGTGRSGDDDPVLEVSITNTESLVFEDLCIKLRDIDSSVSWTTERKLGHMFDQNLVEALKGHSTFPLVRLLIPFHDTTRNKFKTQENTLIDIYLKALNISDDNEDAKKLKRWNQNNSAEDVCTLLANIVSTRSNPTSPHTLGFVNKTLDLLASSGGKSGKSKLELFRDKIIGEYSALEQKWLLRIILARASDKSILSGLKKDSILNHLDPIAKQQYDYCTDLKRTCAIITPEGKRFLESSNADVGIQPLKPFNPMLSRRSNESAKQHGKSMVDAVIDQISGPFIMETKIDGERMLFHMRAQDVLLHSRKGTDYTSKYSILVNNIKRVVELADIDGCIIDGEVAGWDNVNNRALPFGQNRSVGINELAAKVEKYPIRRKNVESDDEDNDNAEINVAEIGEIVDTSSGVEPQKDSTELRFIVFDCLYLSGKSALSIIGDSIREARNTHMLPDIHLHPVYARMQDIENGRGSAGSLLDLPLAVRRLVLLRLLDSVTVADKSFGMVNSSSVTSSDPKERRAEIARFFEAKNQAGEEGIVIKSLNAKYVLNTRTETSWFKLKPDYSQSHFIDMDLLVVGVYYGSGQRSGQFSSFAVAVRADSEDTPGVFRYWPCGKVGSGYTSEEMAYLNNHFNSLEGDDKLIPWPANAAQPASSNAWLATWNATGDVRPDFLTPPGKKSIVFTVKCTELVVSQDFPVKSVLRFPRIQKIRTDKNPDQVLTFGEWKQKVNAPRQSLQHESIADSKRKKESVHSRTTTGSKVDPLFLSSVKSTAPIAGIRYEDGYDVRTYSDGDFFRGMTFLVQPDSFSAKGAQNDQIYAKFASRLASATNTQLEKNFATDDASPGIWSTAHITMQEEGQTLKEGSQSPPRVMATPPTASGHASLPIVYMVNYSAKAFAIFGDTNLLKPQLLRLKGKENHNLTNPITKQKEAGWIFYESAKNDASKTLGLPFIDTSLTQSYTRTDSTSSVYNDQTNESAEKILEETSALPHLEANSFEGISTLIQRNGGTLINSYTSSGSDVLVIVGPNRQHSIRLRNLIKNENCSVLSSEYVIDCAQAQACLPRTAGYYLVRSSVAYEEMRATVDLWGDGLDEVTSAAAMRHMINNAPTLADRFSFQVQAVRSKTGLKRKTAEKSLGVDAIQKKEKSAIANDWGELTKRAQVDNGSWRSLAARFEPDLQEQIREETEISMWNPHIVLYADIPSLENYISVDSIMLYDSKRDSIAGCDDIDSIGLLNLVARLRARGACFRSVLTAEVTHVIASEAREGAMEAALNQLGRCAAKMLAVHVVDETSVMLVQPSVVKRWLDNNMYDQC